MRERAYGDHKPPLPSPPRSYSSLPLHEVTWHMSLYSPPPHPTPPLSSFSISISQPRPLFCSLNETPLSPISFQSSSFPRSFVTLFISPYFYFISLHLLYIPSRTSRRNRSTNCLIPAVDFPANREEENRDNSFE